MKTLYLLVTAQLIALSFSFSSVTDKLQKSQALPSNYTLQKKLDIDFEGRTIFQSSDENWIVYERRNDDGSKNITICIGNRFSLDSFSCASFGNKSQYVYVNDIKFSQNDDTLVVFTNSNDLYVCNVKLDMNDNDCQLKYHQNMFVPSCSGQMDINSQNKIAIFSIQANSIVSILNLKDGQITNQKSFQIEYYFQAIKWHPVDRQIVVLGGYNRIHSYQGVIILLNITSNKTFNLTDLSRVTSMEVSPDGTMIIVGTSNGLQLLQYSQGKAVRKGLINDIVFKRMKISNDSLFLSAYNEKNSKIEVLQVTRLQAYATQANQSLSKGLSGVVTVKSLYSIKINGNINFGSIFYFSSDANQIMTLRSSDLPEIDQYILCPNGTYLSNLLCLNCSKNCSNCRYNETFCYSCPNNSYALIAGECHQCLEFLTGCYTCANQTFCLSCLDFFFMNGNVCKSCDNYAICRSCTSEKNCTKCDDSKGFDPTPINGTCQCQENFTSFNHTCIQCDIAGCTLCNDTNLCVSCSSDVYEDLPGPEGTCIEKQKQESSLMIIIGSSVGGTILITIIGIVVFCKLRKNKRLRQGESIIEEREERMDREEERIHRESVERMVEPLIVQNREKAKYSDEERIRLGNLQQSLISN